MLVDQVTAKQIQAAVLPKFMWKALMSLFWDWSADGSQAESLSGHRVLSTALNVSNLKHK